MAVYVDISRGSLVLQNLYCRIKTVSGGKSSAYYQLELCTEKTGPALPLLDANQTHYTFGDYEDGAAFNVSAAPWAQAYADLKARHSKGLLSWCNAMREEDGSEI
jgi:hypothetical protein